MARRDWPALEADYSPGAEMTDGLSCTCAMPLAWHPALADASERRRLMHEAALLLGALNQMECTHDLENGSAEGRRLERIEAKLDLALNLLARTLEPGYAAPPLEVFLSPEFVEWEEAQAPTDGTPLILELRPSETLPLILRLPAVASFSPPGRARARLENLSEALDEALYQFVFRRHRQAIRARI